MGRPSKTDHVKKICGCLKWKDRAHPWYIDFGAGTETGPAGQVRRRGRLSGNIGKPVIIGKRRPAGGVGR